MSFMFFLFCCMLFYVFKICIFMNFSLGRRWKLMMFLGFGEVSGVFGFILIILDYYFCYVFLFVIKL